MRLSSAQVFDRGIAGITNVSEQLSRTQEQISSGRRILSPADDPVGAARVLELESELSLSAQFQTNINNVSSRLELSETYISSAEEVVNRVYELVLSSANGALSNEARRANVIEIEQRLEELTGLANSRDAKGDYVFSGFRTDIPAFVESGDGFVYQGDEGIRFEQVSNGLQVASNETGKALFADVSVRDNTVTAAPAQSNLGGAQIATARVEDQTAFDAVFPEDYLIEFNNVANVAPPSANYSITRIPDRTPIAVNVPFDINTPIAVNGVEINLTGTPVTGDRFVVESTNKQNLLTTIDRIAQGLATFDNAEERVAFTDRAIVDIGLMQDELLSGRARIGARLNTLESALTAQESLDIINQSAVSELRDLDYAEAVSRLSFQSFVLQAAQQSFVQITGLSLFNFLR